MTTENGRQMQQIKNSQHFNFVWMVKIVGWHFFLRYQPGCSIRAQSNSPPTGPALVFCSTGARKCGCTSPMPELAQCKPILGQCLLEASLTPPIQLWGSTGRQKGMFMLTLKKREGGISEWRKDVGRCSREGSGVGRGRNGGSLHQNILSPSWSRRPGTGLHESAHTQWWVQIQEDSLGLPSCSRR